MKRFLVVAAACIVFASVSLTAQTHAASASSGLTVTPFLQEVQIEPNTIYRTFQVTVAKQATFPQDLHAQVVDFGTLNETGGIAFAGQNASDLIKKYGLANWLHLSQDSFSLAPGQTMRLTATINNNDSLAPGGHYAAILLTSNQQTSSGGQISVNQSVSVLILADKQGGEHYDLKLDRISPDGNLFRLPHTVTMRFFNPGNVHVVPRGTVKVTDAANRVVGQGTINEDSSFILPETYRQIYTTLHSVNPLKWWVQTYKLNINYRYDGLETFASKTVLIRYINPLGLAIEFFILATLAAGIYFGRTKLGSALKALFVWFKKLAISPRTKQR